MTALSAPFVPKGEVAEWRMLMPLFSGKPYGHVVTNDEIEGALGRPIGTNRSPIYRAVMELEKTERRTLTVERGEGYRIALPNEHEGLARGRHRRSRRQLGKAMRTLHATDEARLTPEERETIKNLKNRTSRLEQAYRASTRRIDAVEEVVGQEKKRADSTDERLARIEQALRLAEGD